MVGNVAAHAIQWNFETPNTFHPFRNIPTCHPSEDLFDDIADEDDFDALHYAVNASSGIDLDAPAWARFESYGNIDNSTLCFEPAWWSVGRFSRGEFGVWYGALDEETSMIETSYRPPYIDDNDFNNTIYPMTQTRRLFQAHVFAEAWVDLNKLVAQHPAIVDPVDYRFCQDLGSRAKEEHIELFITPSVRNKGGMCCPVFNPRAIRGDRILRYYIVQWEKGKAVGTIYRSWP